MSHAIRRSVAPFSWSVALHATLAGLLFLGLTWRKSEPLPPVLPIEAVVVDQSVLAAAKRQRIDIERRETEARRLAEEKAEAGRVEAERRVREEADRAAQEQERRREADLAAKREADAKRKAEQQAAAKAAADRKRAAEAARQRAASEADLRARLAAEEQRTSAAARGQRNEYVRMIQTHVERSWFEPPGTAAGVRCVVNVQQIPGGEVVGMRFGTCNGGAAFRQSIENAIKNASPLPPPPDPAQFEREVQLVFTPQVP